MTEAEYEAARRELEQYRDDMLITEIEYLNAIEVLMAEVGDDPNRAAY